MKEGDSSSFFIIEFSAENTGRDTTRSVIQLLGKFGKKGAGDRLTDPFAGPVGRGTTGSGISFRAVGRCRLEKG